MLKITIIEDQMKIMHREIHIRHHDHYDHHHHHDHHDHHDQHHDDHDLAMWP